MNKFLNSPWFYRILALVFALLLFIYVNQSKFLNGSYNQNYTDSRTTQLTSSKPETVSVPLQLNLNSNKYFVTGYPEKVSVKLVGPAALVTTTVNTQNFKIYANLANLKVGKHRVKLYEEGLNNEIRYEINPSYIDVEVQKRSTKTFSVHAKFDKKNIADGYHAGTPILGTQSVKATGAESEIDRIDSVVARLSIPQNAKETVSASAIIEALDSKGRTVNVILTPSTTAVDLPISSGNNKEVSLKFKAEHKDSNKKYSISSDIKSVKIFGTEKQLSGLKDVTVPIDVSDIKSDTTKSIQLSKLVDGYNGFDPEKIKINVNVE
ncbi:YbbR-like protein [Apilactobacillus ozensis DSM 23829 = JCM 17196]|uniref:YbbR-like protein n=1 Tax=Apilactobacillus ozensis DSM 23829 = JCM 17196 TaxID=1423781 RepID=A0A0R2AMK2_9LACO|nr:CdaR family protein [Apilactobacillus ozensis]KRM67698.1 YbbR-like protein [Apilactobacillus ozensis DSM 23829 = JCM 17196]